MEKENEEKMEMGKGRRLKEGQMGSKKEKQEEMGEGKGKKMNRKWKEKSK